jgi:hypothetical protein
VTAFASGGRQGEVTDWREACEHHVTRVLDLATSLRTAIKNGPDGEPWMLNRIDGFGEAVRRGWEPNPSTFSMIGAWAATLLTREGYRIVGTATVTDVLCSKQHDYGHHNISKFGTIGIMVRMSDKAERLKNLRLRDLSPQNESLVDTLLDILGYSVLALMWLDGTFMLELDIVGEELRQSIADIDAISGVSELSRGRIIHEPNAQQLEEFFAAPAVNYEPHYRGELTQAQRQQKLPAEFLKGFER